MASVNVTGIVVLNNPSSFVAPFQFEITFECVKELTADLEWRLTYVGSAESEECDQEIDSVLVGPVPLGVNRFVFETTCPDISKIPKQDLLGVTVVLISCLYKGKEFIRIGYYVNNEYDDPEAMVTNDVGADGMDIVESEDDEDDDDEDDEEPADDEEETAELKENQIPSTNTNMSEDEAPVLPEVISKIQNFQLPPDFTVEKIKRHILDDSPRITRFLIDWDDN